MTFSDDRGEEIKGDRAKAFLLSWLDDGLKVMVGSTVERRCPKPETGCLLFLTSRGEAPLSR